MQLFSVKHFSAMQATHSYVIVANSYEFVSSHS